MPKTQFRSPLQHLDWAASDPGTLGPGQMYTAKHLLNHLSVAPEFVVRPFLPRGEVIELSGPDGTGKSLLALDLATAVAAGRAWLGQEVAPGCRAAFISLEDRIDTLSLRLRARTAAPATPRYSQAEIQRIGGGLYMWGRDEAFKLKLTSCSGSANATINYKVLDFLMETIPKVDLLVLETATRLHAGKESNEDLTALGGALESLAQHYDAAVLLVRHVSKAATRDRVSDNMTGRGGSALSQMIRGALTVTRVEKRRTKEEKADPDYLESGPEYFRLRHAKGTHGGTRSSPPKYYTVKGSTDNGIWIEQVNMATIQSEIGSVAAEAAVPTEAIIDSVLEALLSAGTKGLTVQQLQDQLHKRYSVLAAVRDDLIKEGTVVIVKRRMCLSPELLKDA